MGKILQKFENQLLGKAGSLTSNQDHLLKIVCWISEVPEVKGLSAKKGKDSWLYLDEIDTLSISVGWCSEHAY